MREKERDRSDRPRRSNFIRVTVDRTRRGRAFSLLHREKGKRAFAQPAPQQDRKSCSSELATTENRSDRRHARLVRPLESFDRSAERRLSRREERKRERGRKGRETKRYARIVISRVSSSVARIKREFRKFGRIPP